MIYPNKMKDLFEKNIPAIGTLVKSTDPAVVEILGLCGFDFFVLDNEHVAMSREAMTNMIRAASGIGIVPLVRVRENRAVEILQALDAGAAGVQVPNVDTVEDAKALIESVKYTPEGNRGLSPTVRAAGYGLIEKMQYIKMSNENNLVVAHCETVTCVNNLNEILKLPGLDVVFIGPMDLSQSMGLIGQDAHPAVAGTIDTIIEKTCLAGKIAGIIAGNPEKAKAYIRKGVRYILLGTDQGMLSSTAQQWIKAVRE